MTSKILKSTPRGQITLPKKWRDSMGTDQYLVEMHENKLVIVPLQLDASSGESVIFDADRDNDGKGANLDTMIRLLKSIK